MSNQYREELAKTAQQICSPGKGILAADESTGTIGKKFEGVGIENTEANRRNYRQLLFTTPGINQYISGVILYDETARQSSDQGVNVVKQLNDLGIVAGIKVDKGLQILPGTQDETWTAGLDTLAKETKEYYKMGIRFAKWRAVLKIDEKNNLPSKQAIQENAWNLARYGAICQENGLVPIIEPEILSDGPHSIEYCQKITERVNQAVNAALVENNLFFEGMLYKPNMVTAGSTNPDRAKSTPQEIAWRTATALSRSIFPACVGITFLSGGQSEEEASLNLNAMNQLTNVHRPWVLSFSYGRALQNTCVKTWAGKAENVKAAQDALIVRAKANSEAQLGKYQGSKDGAGSDSLFVADYKY